MSNLQTVLITDSTNDLPAELLEEHQIGVVPLTIVWNNNQYLDGVDLKRADFYSKFATDPGQPSTLPPRSQCFIDAYNAAASKGATKIVVMTMSSAMSGTYENARTAALGYKLPITVVDSKSTSMGMGFQLLAMAKVAEAGGSIAEMVQSAARVRKSMEFRVALDTLDYMIKGGRVTGMAKRLGHMFKIKPQIRFNLETGAADPGDITATRSKAVDSLYNTFTKKFGKSKSVHVAVMHNLADEEALQMSDRIKVALNPLDISISIISPVLGTHAGPRALGLCAYSEQ